jgi:hypothetical protein
MKLLENKKMLENTLDVVNAFLEADDIGVRIEHNAQEYGYYITINLLDYSTGTENREVAIRKVMKKVLAKLETSKIFRREVGFDLIYRDTVFHLYGYPTEYTVTCTKSCFAVKGDKRIQLNATEEITVEEM